MFSNYMIIEHEIRAHFVQKQTKTKFQVLTKIMGQLL